MVPGGPPSPSIGSTPTTARVRQTATSSDRKTDRKHTSEHGCPLLALVSPSQSPPGSVACGQHHQRGELQRARFVAGVWEREWERARVCCCHDAAIDFALTCPCALHFDSGLWAQVQARPPARPTRPATSLPRRWTHKVKPQAPLWQCRNRRHQSQHQPIATLHTPPPSPHWHLA